MKWIEPYLLKSIADLYHKVAELVSPWGQVI